MSALQRGEILGVPLVILTWIQNKGKYIFSFWVLESDKIFYSQFRFIALEDYMG